MSTANMLLVQCLVKCDWSGGPYHDLYYGDMKFMFESVSLQNITAKVNGHCACLIFRHIISYHIIFFLHFFHHSCFIYFKVCYT